MKTDDLSSIETPPTSVLPDLHRGSWGCASALLAMLLVAIVHLDALSGFSSSTAAIALFFIPFFVLPYGFLFLILGRCLPDLLAFIQRRPASASGASKTFAVVAAMMISSMIGGGVYGTAEVCTANRVASMTEAELNEFSQNSIWRRNRFVLGAFAQNPNTSAAVLDEVARSQNPSLYKGIGSLLPLMPEFDQHSDVMQLVAVHRNVSGETLTKLARSRDLHVRGSVASNPTTPVPVLEKLAKDTSTPAVYNLAKNPSTPPDILRRFAQSKFEGMRGLVAGNPSTPKDVLEKLAADSARDVRRAVAENPSCSREILDQLARNGEGKAGGKNPSRQKPARNSKQKVGK